VRRLERAWPYLLPGAVLLPLLGAALVHPLTTLPTNPLGDLPARFAPLRHFGFSELRAGHLALWNPRIFGGVPHVGGIESALFYPPNWLHLVLPLGLALNLSLLFHLWLAGALTAFWARRLGASRAGAALAGLAWILSGPVFPHLFAGHLTVLCALAWAPLLYAAVDGWLDEGEPGWLLAGAAASALQALSGNPQVAYYSALGALVYGALKLPGRPRKIRAAVGLGGLFVLAAGISAIQLLPALEAARESTRAGAGYDFAAAFSLPPENLLTVVAPHWLGGRELPYFGRLYFWEASLFVGFPIFLLALACAPSRRRGLLGGVATLGVLALGAHTPIFQLLWKTLPGFSYFRGSAKFSAQAALLLCVAAGLGYDRAVKQENTRRMLVIGGAVLVGVFALMTAASLMSVETWGRILAALARSGETWADPALYLDPAFRRACSIEAAWSFGLASAAAAAAAGALALRKYRLLWLIAATELVLFAAAHRGLSPVSQPVPEALTAALAREPQDARFMTDWTRRPNLSMVIGRDEVWGYDQLPLKRWAMLGAFTQGRRDLGAGLYQHFDRVTPELALMQVRVILLEDPAPRVVRPKAALPRAFLARAIPAAPGLELERMAAPGFDMAAEAVVSAGVPASAKKPRGSASVRELSTDELEVEAETDAPVVLVMTDAYSAGWTARALPGSAQAHYDVVPADLALRAVPLKPGRHRLRLFYAPRSWPAAVALTLFSLLFWSAAIAHRSLLQSLRKGATLRP